MHAFDYEAPSSLAEAISHLERHAGEARPMAGGTDLIDQMRTGRHSPKVLIDLKQVKELNVFTVDDHGLRLGAAVSCRRICREKAIAEHYAALDDCCRIIGGIQIQSRASIGGNLCNSGPAADSTPAMIALGAVCLLAGPSGERKVPIEAFCTGPGKNVLGPGELLVEFQCPPPPRHSGSHYRRMIPRNEMDIAVVGVGASVTLDESHSKIEKARIALGAVAPTPLWAEEASKLLVGQSVDDSTIAKASEAARKIVAPITDMRGSQEYRVHATGVLVQRVLQTAIARARGDATNYRPGH